MESDIYEYVAQNGFIYIALLYVLIYKCRICRYVGKPDNSLKRGSRAARSSLYYFCG